MSFLILQRVISQIVSIALVLALIVFYVVPTHFAEAATITSAFDTMSNLTASATSTHAITFNTPTGANQNTDDIVITFPSDFNFTGKTIGTVSFTHGTTTGAENTETLAATPSATAWGAVFSGTQNRVLTLTAPSDGIGAHTVSPNHKMIISYTGTNSVNPTTPGSYAIAISGTFGDAGSMTVNILSNSQVAITATVPQALTFSISDNSISFGALSAASARYASGTASGQATEVEAHNVIVGTNASNGYTMTLAGNTLTAGANTINAIGAANTASSAGTEQFGVRMSASGGSGAVVVPYAAAGFAFDSGAFPDIIASASGSSANTTYSARYLANITSNTEAGTYAATLTYVATANF